MYPAALALQKPQIFGGGERANLGRTIPLSCNWRGWEKERFRKNNSFVMQLRFIIMQINVYVLKKSMLKAKNRFIYCFYEINEVDKPLPTLRKKEKI